MLTPSAPRATEAIRAIRVHCDSKIRAELRDMLDRELGGQWLIEFRDGTFREIDGFRAHRLGIQHLLDAAHANAKVA